MMSLDNSHRMVFQDSCHIMMAYDGVSDGSHMMVFQTAAI